MPRRSSRTFNKPRLRQHAAVIADWRDHKRKADVAAALAIGKELVGAQTVLARYGDGVFGRWCREEAMIGRTTAYKMMNAYRTFGDCPECVQTFDLSALYLLSTPGLRRETIEEAMALARQGGRLEHRRAKLMLQEWEGHEMEEAAPPQKPTWLEPIEQRTPLDRLMRAWEMATAEQRKTFKQWTKERQMPTTIDVATGRRKLRRKQACIAEATPQESDEAEPPKTQLLAATP